MCLCVCACLVSEVPQSDGGVVAGGDAELFSRMSSQTPDSSPSMTVQQYVGRRILLPNLNDFPVFRPHQDLTLKKKRTGLMWRTEGGRQLRDEAQNQKVPTLPLQTDRTHSTCCPVSSWNARQRFIS